VKLRPLFGIILAASLTLAVCSCKPITLAIHAVTVATARKPLIELPASVKSCLQSNSEWLDGNYCIVQGSTPATMYVSSVGRLTIYRSTLTLHSLTSDVENI